jgi:hypothetical protein
VRWISFWGCNVSVVREQLLGIGGYDETIKGWGCEDTDVGYRLCQAGAEYVSAPLARALHYPHPTSPSNAAEALRNIRWLLRRHPSLDMELSLWLCHFSVEQKDFSLREGESAQETAERRMDFLNEFDASVAAVWNSTPQLTPELGALERWVRSFEGPVAWFGGSDNWASSAGPPAAISDPFVRERQGPSLALLGLVTGWADQELAAAVASEYWTRFPPVVVRAMARELTRISRRCYFLADDTSASSLAGILGPGFQSHREGVEGLAGARIFQVRGAA